MIKKHKCDCGEINPKNFYKNQKSVCKICRSKLNKEKYIPTKKLSLLEKLTQGYTINQFTGCWIWNKFVDDNGYGRLSYNSKPYLTHRVSYKLFNGEIPKGLFVCHKCDTPSCVNPAHLFLGTHDDNMADMVGKGRAQRKRGEENSISILTEAQAQEIINFNHYHGSLTYLAKKFNTSPQTIYYVRHGKTWTHLKKTI